MSVVVILKVRLYKFCHSDMGMGKLISLLKNLLIFAVRLVCRSAHVH